MVHSRGRLEVEVRRAERADLPEVVALHRACFANPAGRPLEEVHRKIAGLFFDGPLISSALPSLVARTPDGTLVAFRGWLSRRWRLGSELLPGRCATHHMVHPEFRRMGVAAATQAVYRKITDGHPADMIGFSDRTSDDGKRFADATRRDTGRTYRLEHYGFIWTLPLRRLPLRESAGVPRRLGLGGDLGERAAALIASLRPARGLALDGAPELRGAPLSAASLAEVHAALDADFPLHLDESPEAWRWIDEYLNDYPSRGRCVARVWLSGAGEPIGFYVAYLKPTGYFEISAFAVLRDHLEAALAQVLRDAANLGARTATGWASARELRPLLALGAELRVGRRAAISTGRADVRLHFEAMEALFSGLEGERWL